MYAHFLRSVDHITACSILFCWFLTLERMVGKLTMENELLKKAVTSTVSRRNASSPRDIVTGSGVSLKLARRSK